MLLHKQTFILGDNRRFSTLREFRQYVFGGFETPMNLAIAKLTALLNENRLLYSCPILSNDGNSHIVTRLWIDEAAKLEYDLFVRANCDTLTLEKVLKERKVRIREISQEV